MLVLLRWWFITCLTVVGLVIAGLQGAFQYLWQADATKLSYVALAVFVSINIFVGMLAYRSRTGDQGFVKHLSFCWLVAELLLGIGMIGTLCGFLLLLHAAFGTKIDIANLTAMSNMLSNMAVGFSTSGVTTIVGLAASLIIKLQLVNLEYMIDDRKTMENV